MSKCETINVPHAALRPCGTALRLDFYSLVNAFRASCSACYFSVRPYSNCGRLNSGTHAHPSFRWHILHLLSKISKAAATTQLYSASISSGQINALPHMLWQLVDKLDNSSIRNLEKHPLLENLKMSDCIIADHAICIDCEVCDE